MAFSFFGSSPQPQQQQSLFQTPAQSSPFFQTQQQQQQLQQQQQQQQQQLQLQQQLQQQQPQQQQPQQQQLYLLTKDKSPAHYNTKWADLHPDSQKFLLQIEERILEYRDESQRLDQCSRLYEASVTNDGFEQDASHIVQELGGISTAMDREKLLLQDLMAVVKDLMRNTEVAVRSYMMLRPRFIHPSNPSPSTASTAQMSSGALVPAPISQPMSSVAPVFDFYSGVPKRPSPFLQQTVSRFEKYVSECRQLIEELEQLLLNGDGGSSGANLSLLQSLPKVMSNVHEFFIHVAAKVENLHQYIESMKTAYLADQKRRGDASDPFLEADRREIAKQEAAARRVHPTLHLPAQPSTQVAGLFASSSQVTPAVPQPSLGASAASTGSGFSMFGTPSSSASFLTPPSSSLFSTPSSAAPTSSLFGTPSFSPQPSVLGSASPSLFGPAQTPSVFPGQFASGGSMGSGSSFGATSKSAKPKSRTARR